MGPNNPGTSLPQIQHRHAWLAQQASCPPPALRPFILNPSFVVRAGGKFPKTPQPPASGGNSDDEDHHTKLDMWQKEVQAYERGIVEEYFDNDWEVEFFFNNRDRLLGEDEDGDGGGGGVGAESGVNRAFKFSTMRKRSWRSSQSANDAKVQQSHVEANQSQVAFLNSGPSLPTLPLNFPL